MQSKMDAVEKNCT
jgi:hypothetical protein